MTEVIALVEFRNCAPGVYRIKSEKPITIEDVARHFRETDLWNEERDSITLIGDGITEITI